VVTADSNIAVYAFSDAGEKSAIAADTLGRIDFVSAQVLNEFTNVAWRKQGRSWPEIASKVADIRATVGRVLPIEESDNDDAIRIADRYRLSFYDALMLAVALKGGARTIYSEDLHHGLVIDDTLRIIDPFR
jgi:predicted nucleic acid-binding protein